MGKQPTNSERMPDAICQRRTIRQDSSYQQSRTFLSRMSPTTRTTSTTLIRFRCFLFDSMLSILYCIPILGLVSLLSCVRLGSTRERPAVSASDLRGSDRQVVSVSREREWAIRKDSPVSARDSPVCPASDWAIRKDSPVSRKGECGSQGGRDRKVQNENQHTLEF